MKESGTRKRGRRRGGEEKEGKEKIPFPPSILHLTAKVVFLKGKLDIISWLKDLH